MIDEKLTDKVGPSAQDEMLSTLKEIEKHMRALVYYSTPEKAFISSAGMAKTPTTQPPAESALEEVVAQEINKYLKENKWGKKPRQALSPSRRSRPTDKRLF